ncbi:MAG: FAD-binding protein [Acidobacteria bacterium]|nr:FAD-binding protein [Acidobacteriota bacterium]
MAISPEARAAFLAAVGAAGVRDDEDTRQRYGTDALLRGHPADLVVVPSTVDQIAAITRVCRQFHIPLVVRGAGTGYTGGAVPVRGGVVLSMERFTRILEIDEVNQLAIVEPNVLTGDLQTAVEARGLFYPPDPASLAISAIGGNVAECAGGPRAVKYGTTRRYVLALQAVLPTGEIIRTGSKAVKNVVGYDLTQLLIGSEGTLAILTEITLRLLPKPAAVSTITATFADVAGAVGGVTALLAARVLPSTIELIDGGSLRAVERYLGRTVAPKSAGAMLVIEVDGVPGAVADEAALVTVACRAAGAIAVDAASDSAERDRLWEARRSLSYALRAAAPRKINHDVSVPRGHVPALFALLARLERDHDLWIPSFGHAGDGNIHVNFMVDPADAAQMTRAAAAADELFRGVVALEGSISGEHGIGFSKAQYLSLELSPDVIALMQRVKAAFDPSGILNPGKIWIDG